MECGRLFAAAVLGTAMFFGCGDDECEILEKTYELGTRVYVPAERSSDFNVNKGILVDEDVTGVLEFWSWPYEYLYVSPNTYTVECRADGTDHLFEFFISKSFPDGSYEFIGSNNGSPAGSCYSGLLGADDLEGVVGVTCGIRVPEKWECDGYGCWVVQEREHLGTVKAGLEYVGMRCFDIYY